MESLAYRIFTVCCHTIAASYLLIALIGLYQLDFASQPSRVSFEAISRLTSS